MSPGVAPRRGSYFSLLPPAPSQKLDYKMTCKCCSFRYGPARADSPLRSHRRDPDRYPTSLRSPLSPKLTLSPKVSDTAFANPATDRSGPLLRDLLSSLPSSPYSIISAAVVPDDPDEIRRTVEAWCDGDVNLVLTTGGTGFGVRDKTPEVSHSSPLSPHQQLTPTAGSHSPDRQARSWPRSSHALPLSLHHSLGSSFPPSRRRSPFAQLAHRTRLAHRYASWKSQRREGESGEFAEGSTACAGARGR